MAKYQAHSATSRAAAAHAERRELRDQARVLAFYKRRGEQGATSDEVQRQLKLLHQTGSARVADLLQDGKIVESGHRRRTRHGRWADVLILAPPGTPAREPRARHQLEGFSPAQLARLLQELQGLHRAAELSDWKLPETTKLLSWLRRKAPHVK